MTSTSIPSREERPSRSRPAERGFTLLEVIVALAIMAVGFVTIIDLYSTSIRAVDLSDQYLEGLALANNKIGELELTDFDSVNFATEDFSGTFPANEKYRWSLAITPYDTPLNNEKDNIRVQSIRLKVSWEDLGKPRSLELTTLKTLGKTYPSSNGVLSGLDKTGSGGGGKNQSVFGGGGGGAGGSGGGGTLGGQLANLSGGQTPSTSISGATTTPRISGAP